MKNFFLITALLATAYLNSACSPAKGTPDIRGVYDITDMQSEEDLKKSPNLVHYLYIYDSATFFNFNLDSKTGAVEISKHTFVKGDIHSGGTYYVSKNCSRARTAILETEAWSSDYKAALEKVKLSGNESDFVIFEIKRIESSTCSNMKVKLFGESSDRKTTKSK